MKRITYTSMSCKTAIRLVGVARNQANGFPARLLDVQLETWRRFCENNGLVVVAEFRDIQSRLDIDRRQYQQALSLARVKGFGQIVVYRYDRSGRDDAEYFGMLKDFAKQGIQLVSASGESPDPLYQKLAGVLAWDESRRLSIRVTGSKMKRHEEGKWNGKPVFGYAIHQLRWDQQYCPVCRENGAGGCILVKKDSEAELVIPLDSRQPLRTSPNKKNGVAAEMATPQANCWPQNNRPIFMKSGYSQMESLRRP